MSVIEERVLRVPSTGGAEAVVYDWGGPGDAPTMVFAHATGLHAHMWVGLASILRDRVRCMAIDMRAHGSARRPDEGIDAWAGFGDDVALSLDALDLSGRGDVIGVGHSMGGCALIMAELSRRGTFSQLFLYEPIVMPVAEGEQLPPRPAHIDGERSIAVAARKRRETFSSRQAAFENFSSKPPFGSCDPEIIWAYVEHGFEDLPDGTIRLRCRSADEADTFAASQTDVWLRLDDFGPHVIIAAGEQSERLHLDLAPPQAARFPSATLLMLQDRTHFGPFERTAQFAEQMASALGLEPRDAP